VTTETTATLFLGRPLCTRMDVLIPDLKATVRGKQFQSMVEGGQRLRAFNVGQPVGVRDYRRSFQMVRSIMHAVYSK